MKQLINPKGPPIPRVGRRRSRLVRVHPFGPINVVMHNQFHEAKDRDKHHWRPADQQGADRKRRMQPGMLRTPQMDILPTAGQHARRLQKKIRKQVFDLQQ